MSYAPVSTTQSKKAAAAKHQRRRPIVLRQKTPVGAIPKNDFHVGSLPIQPKLKVGKPNDKYEQEADRVADHVMQMSESQVQRQVALSERKEHGQTQSEETTIQRMQNEDEEMVQTKSIAETIQRICTACEEEETLQRVAMEEEEDILQPKRESSQVSSVAPTIQTGIERLRQTGGATLPASTRAFMEPRFGHDFSQVRIHAGTEAAQLAHGLQARAFTVGRDIVFGKGALDYSSSTGKSLLAHELTHYVQQRGNNVNENLSGQTSLIQRKACDPLAQDCPTGTACFSTGSTYECLPTIAGAFENLVKKILKTKGIKIKETDKSELQAFIDRDKSPGRLKELEKIIVLWPSFGNIRKKAQIIEMVTAPIRKTDLEESQRGRFSEKEGGEIKTELVNVMKERIRLEKEKIIKENEAKPRSARLTDEKIDEAAKDKELNSCLDFLKNSSLAELYADEEDERKTASSLYKEGMAERKQKTKIHAKTLSRLASELRLQGLVGPVHLLKWKGTHEKGHHEPSPTDLFDRLSSAGDGWYFFLVGLLSFHTFLIAVHVSEGGSRRRYFEIQGGQAVRKTPKQLKQWFDRDFDPSNFNPKHKRNVGSRVWQVYLRPTD